MELLAISIRNNDQIKGINVVETEIKISQLADDTTCFLSDTASVSHLIQVFKDFKLCTGLKVNIEKTKAKFIGSLKHRTDSPFGLEWTNDNISLLGLTLSGNENDYLILNFKKRIKNLKATLSTWKGRGLSLKGKFTVINNLALPPLLYAANILYVPKTVFKEVKQHVVDFLWDSKPPKIAYDVMIQDIHDGGLKLMDFENKTKALRVMWVKRLCSPIFEKWKAIPRTYFKTNDFTTFFKFNLPPQNYSSLFYQEIQNIWSELKQFENASPDQLKSEVIWNNRCITLEKKPLLWKTWMNNGIFYISDILDNHGDFLNFTQINKKYHIKCNFLNMLQLKQSIPFSW